MFDSINLTVPNGHPFKGYPIQRRSHLLLVGAAEIERRRRKCERHSRDAILGGPGACPTGKFLNERCDFVHSGMILSSDFGSFCRIFLVLYALIL